VLLNPEASVYSSVYPIQFLLDFILDDRAAISLLLLAREAPTTTLPFGEKAEIEHFPD
jgi:hypothetical protein